MSAAEDHATNGPIQSPDLLRESIESLSEGLAIYGPDFRLIAFNRRYAEMLHPIADLIVPGALWQDLLRACVERGVYAEPPAHLEDWIASTSGEPWKQLEDLEIVQADGRIYAACYRPTSFGGFLVTRTDITERRRAEATIRDREALLATVLDTIPVAIVMARKDDGRIIYRSAEAQKDFPVEFAQSHFVNPQERFEYVAALQELGRISDYRVDLRRGDGSVFRASLSGRLVEHGGESYVVSAISDMTERLGKEELLRHVVELLPDPTDDDKARQRRGAVQQPRGAGALRRAGEREGALCRAGGAGTLRAGAEGQGLGPRVQGAAAEAERRAVLERVVLAGYPLPRRGRDRLAHARPEQADGHRGRARQPARADVPEREAVGDGRAAGRRRARAEQPALGGGRPRADAAGQARRSRHPPPYRADQRRRRALRAHREDLPEHGPPAADKDRSRLDQRDRPDRHRGRALQRRRRPGADRLRPGAAGCRSSPAIPTRSRRSSSISSSTPSRRSAAPAGATISSCGRGWRRAATRSSSRSRTTAPASRRRCAGGSSSRSSPPRRSARAPASGWR